MVLDMDGTLVSSYTPARAPRLPAGMLSYIVGRGARINPKGVFVVERPGLLDFFAKLSEFAGEFLISTDNILGSRGFWMPVCVMRLLECRYV